MRAAIAMDVFMAILLTRTMAPNLLRYMERVKVDRNGWSGGGQQETWPSCTIEIREARCGDVTRPWSRALFVIHAPTGAIR